MKRGREDPSDAAAAVVGRGSAARSPNPARAVVATVVAGDAVVIPRTDVMVAAAVVAEETVPHASSDVKAATSDLIAAGEGGDDEGGDGEGGDREGNPFPPLEGPSLPPWVNYVEESPFEEYVTDEESEVI